jgi:hypothetical protein
MSHMRRVVRLILNSATKRILSTARLDGRTQALLRWLANVLAGRSFTEEARPDLDDAGVDRA